MYEVKQPSIKNIASKIRNGQRILKDLFCMLTSWGLKIEF